MSRCASPPLPPPSHADPQSDILAASTANFSALVNATYPQSPRLRLDTSNYPNPFRGVAPATFSDAGETILSLVDGGEDGQVTPLQPMLVEGRAIDVIVAIDAVSCVSL
jgi:lysophospholipase